MPLNFTAEEVMPTSKDIEKILTAKLSFEAAQKRPDKDNWNKTHFKFTPWGISYTASRANARRKGSSQDQSQSKEALKYFIIAVALDWRDLTKELTRTIKLWGYTAEDFQQIAAIWKAPTNIEAISKTIETVSSSKIDLKESIEKHEVLNSKLFTKDEVLKDRVRDKMLEIVDEFLANLKEQDIDIKVEDIIFIGSNASYNYTKDSDIDLHILVNTKAVKYEANIANALYSAYRTLFNKQLDIKLFDIPLEIFIETEDSQRVSNGVYSVKRNEWIKRPVKEDIPDYDKEVLKELVDKWEAKCKDLIAEIKADKLENEDKVVKLLEDIYEKLRKKGIAKGEYSEENLAFKELRNKGYLDQLKQSKDDLVSKRLSLEERLDGQARRDVYNQITRVAGTQPIIQDNGMFFIYNLKESKVNSVVNALKKLPCVLEATAYDSGKYDFSDVLRIATHKMPAKYYSIRGQLTEA